MTNKIIKKLEPFIAIGIFIMLLMLVFGLSKHVSLQKDIKENCGYETNKYYCVCYDSNSPEALKDIQEKKYKKENINLSNITWD